MSARPDRPTSRRDALRALGAGALGLPLAGCGTGWAVPRLPGPPPEPVEAAPPPAVEPVPVPEGGGVEPLPRAEAPPEAPPAPTAVPARVLPPRLPAGGVVGLVAPAGVLRSSEQVEDAVASLAGLGFRTKVGRHVLDQRGFLAGDDADRARDVMDMFRDPDVDAVLALRGGWGCARILPLLDYAEIAAHPKPLVGYSDITALLLAVYARTGLVTFHGPVGVSTWRGRTAHSFVETLVEGRPLAIGPETRPVRDRTVTVTPGVAEGPLAGGNLSVVAGLAGTGYLPDFAGHVVFFEEVSEDAYRVDRLLVQLELAGAFERAAAVVFGQCTRCSSDSGWTAERTIRERLAAYGCPALFGAPIGHASPVYTLPVGLPAVVDADAGTVEFRGPAVA